STSASRRSVVSSGSSRYAPSDVRRAASCRASSVADVDQARADLHGVARPHEDLKDFAGALGEDGVLHLHGFDQGHTLPRLHHVAWAYEYCGHLTWQRCGEHAVAGAGLSRGSCSGELGAIADRALDAVLSRSQPHDVAQCLELEQAAVDFGDVACHAAQAPDAPRFGGDLHANSSARVARVEGHRKLATGGAHEILLRHDPLIARLM